MGLFRRKKPQGPQLDRQEALSARPVLNRLVKVERGQDGNIVLQVPRRDTATVRTMARVFGMPPYRKVALDELGTFVIELCDGRHTVRELARKLSGRFRLNRREAEVSVSAFLRDLGRRSIVGLVMEDRDARQQ
jgi:hypothetical protein